MIATLSILLVLAVAASRMLGSITEIGLGHRDSILQRTTVLRFAQSLRGDVGESVGIATSDEGWPLELVSPDQRVEYRWNPESKRLLRTVRSSSDGEAMGRVVARDVYPLGKRVEPRVVVSEDQVSVILRTPSAGPTWIVEAPR